MEIETNKRKTKNINKFFFCCKPREEMPKKDVALKKLKNELNLPFQGELPQNLKPGDVLSIYGFVLPHCVRFAINLTCDHTKSNCDVGFHFNPRLSPRYIARNARINGIWGIEETTSNVKFDIPRSTRIVIEILFAEFTFEVTINGKHVCGFAYRMPLSSLKHLEINGAIIVENIFYRKVAVFPDNVQLNDNFYHVPVQKEAKLELCNCTDENVINIPFLGSLPRGIPSMYKIEIQGRTKLLPHIFFINLQIGRHIWPHPSVPLHLNPRFNTVLGENVLIRNSWTHGSWQNEERSSVFPFVPGEKFKIVIYREPEHYAIWINDKLNGEFKYRNTDVEEVDTIYIQGDMVLNKVFIHELEKKTNGEDILRKSDKKVKIIINEEDRTASNFILLE